MFMRELRREAEAPPSKTGIANNGMTSGQETGSWQLQFLLGRRLGRLGVVLGKQFLLDGELRGIGYSKGNPSSGVGGWPFRTARKVEWREATNFRIGATCFKCKGRPTLWVSGFGAGQSKGGMGLEIGGERLTQVRWR